MNVVVTRVCCKVFNQLSGTLLELMNSHTLFIYKIHLTIWCYGLELWCLTPLSPIYIQQVYSQLPMRSKSITTNVLSSSPAHGEVYSIQHYVTCGRLVLVLRVLRCQPTINWMPPFSWNIGDNGVKHHNSSPVLCWKKYILSLGESLYKSVMNLTVNIFSLRDLGWWGGNVEREVWRLKIWFNPPFL
jgi:hypothetical protein